MRLNCLLSSRRNSVFAAALAILSAALAGTSAAEEPNGEKVFTAKCAMCHGAHGEGTKKTKHRLEGDRTVSQLVEVINKTMPEDDPGTLSDEDTKIVAAYIHDAFYSPIARERNRAARIELTRLTVRQYRQSLADLVAGFRDLPVKWDAQQGLKGEYFKGKQMRPDARMLDRIDPQVKFDFGETSPVPDKIEPHEFGLRWQGSILAPETGEYELIVRTDQAARLWVNDLNKAAIDAWVKSGNDTEYKTTMFLVAGRAYPLKLEFSKATHGEKDKNQKDKEVKRQPAHAFVSLDWRRPTGVAESIPARNLAPVMNSESYICAAGFPPDDRSYGWERGATVSKGWDQAATDAAIDAATYIAARLPDLASAKDDAKDRVEKMRAFCRAFAQRAFRRPLTPEQTELLIDKQFKAAASPEMAVKRSIVLVLKSPEFLYREISDKPDTYDVASRLSFALWDSIPDQELLRAAKDGNLNTKEQVAKQAERMLTDQRAKAKLREFLFAWLKADQARDLAKDAKKYPDFDAAVIADLRTSLEMFLDQVVWSEASDYRQLLSADYVYLNGRLAKFYGVDQPPDSDFTQVKLNAEQRAGVLTHPYLMTSFAHSGESSPIHRGVFLARGVLGMSLRPPPEAIAPLAPELQPTLTTRERVSLQTQATACTTCHGLINPLGFTLEHFDAVGRYREEDHDKPIDATGSYRTSGGKEIKVNGARELAAFLADSEEAHSAFVEQLFHHLVQQSVHAYGPNSHDDLRKSFESGGYNIRKLAVEIVATSALTPREIKAEKTAATNSEKVLTTKETKVTKE